MSNVRQDSTRQILELGSASELTRGMFFGDYYDGVMWPIIAFKHLPG